MTLPIIEFKDIIYYSSTNNRLVKILDHFNLQIYPKDKVVIFGQSGSGKTTLLRLLLGLTKPTSGTIFINQQPLTEKNVWQMRTLFAYVDQDVIIGQGKIKQLINDYFCLQANKNIGLNWTQVNNLLARFELDPNILDKNSDHISGGERQRIALIIALLLKRPIMLLDEATSSLDPTTKKIIVKEILSYANLTLLSVTHDLVWLKQAKVKTFDFKEKKWLQI